MGASLCEFCCMEPHSLSFRVLVGNACAVAASASGECPAFPTFPCRQPPQSKASPGGCYAGAGLLVISCPLFRGKQRRFWSASVAGWRPWVVRVAPGADQKRLYIILPIRRQTGADFSGHPHRIQNKESNVKLKDESATRVAAPCPRAGRDKPRPRNRQTPLETPLAKYRLYRPTRRSDCR